MAVSDPAPDQILNQPPPLEDYDLLASDRALLEGLEREGADWAVEELGELGRLAGSAEAIQWGVEANAHPPQLRSFDRFGHRIDEVSFHPAWHELMKVAVAHGLHASPWREPRPGAHVARAAGFYLWSQVEAGHGCPISMTYAAVPALRTDPELAAEWEPRLTSLRYDFGLHSPGAKAGCLAGMAMTEKQGGSDVLANLTVAAPAGDGGYLLSGHKWFCSAPMGDVFLVLAQAPEGLSCFVLPRMLEDGTRNRFHIQRLKDKLGNRSNASSEIELDQAWARRLGPEGRGVQTIIEMVNHTRLDCVIGSASLMRQAVAQATHHAAHRSAFGHLLVDQPLMLNVLADMALDAEAATAVMVRLAGAFDRAPHDPAEFAFRRLATAVSKFWVCKRAVVLAGEALECLGGNGYVEESMMPRLYREAPLLSVWEGSGNVNALDVLRAMQRQPESVTAFMDELSNAAGVDRSYDLALERLRGDLAEVHEAERRARRVVELMALLLQGSLLIRNAPSAVADAFCAARLGGEAGSCYGTLPVRADLRAIVTRAQPLH